MAEIIIVPASGHGIRYDLNLCTSRTQAAYRAALSAGGKMGVVGTVAAFLDAEIAVVGELHPEMLSANRGRRNSPRGLFAGRHPDPARRYQEIKETIDV